MAQERKDSSSTDKNQKTKEPQAVQIRVNPLALYKYDPTKKDLDIETQEYANQTFITVAQRDVWIDFLRLPGIPSGERTSLKANRIYLSHLTAKLLGQALLEGLKRVSELKGIEEFTPPP